MKSPLYISPPDITLTSWVQFNIYVAGLNPLYYRLCLVDSMGCLYVLLHTGSCIGLAGNDSIFSRRSVFSISEVCPWNTFEELGQTPKLILHRVDNPSFLGDALSFNTFEELKHEVQNLILEHSL